MIQEKKNTKYECANCNYITYKISNFERHNLSQKHLNIVDAKQYNSNNICTVCDVCQFITNNKNDYKRHILTKKHLNNEKAKHDNNTPFMMEMFMEFMKQNKEMQQAIVELAKNQSVTNNNTTNNNTTNQQFNLQLFLNETCKDAMNITDFVNSLQLKMEDFEETGKIGFVEGISRIIINGLKQVDTTKRPIHCTDVKRETLYIKNDNSWEKDDQNKGRLKQAVNQVARMNLCQLPKWQQLNPDSAIIDTIENDKYVKYSIAALGGRSNEEETKMVDKIMRNIIKEVVIDKS
jgi:hypothetical protein